VSRNKQIAFYFMRIHVQLRPSYANTNKNFTLVLSSSRLFCDTGEQYDLNCRSRRALQIITSFSMWIVYFLFFLMLGHVMLLLRCYTFDYHYCPDEYR